MSATKYPKVTDPSSLRILVSNDDGINAPGLKILKEVAEQLSDDVWVVAPETEQSGASHSLTLSRPLRIRQISDRRYSVDGTPTDCVLLGVNHILKDKKPTLVLSGVNYNSNLGEEVTYSGTVAAAMEATLLGIPAIALSQVIDRRHPPKWATALHFAPDIIRNLLKTYWPKECLMNINFPDAIIHSVKGTKVVPQGFRDLSGGELWECKDPRNRPYYWIGPLPVQKSFTPRTDLSAIEESYISITPLHLDLTHHQTLNALKKTFKE
ncbi:MAG: 5'/3'-nucleotidase SurE [Alphaproteobacteria bacterium]|jgi:5'-nucleotidase|nr:5'/3'-nucleotidase SurE [Alphaproteobacteria bacterium]MBT5389353.1 5'/3'-nucleotidase SurE [Alphaproteobacteria bacterium]MBT5541029.1 5'/3'-nucleotidase SurE [Alphaproteobacteria bacterium]